MKDNTLLYVGLGLAAVYLVTRRNSNTLPAPSSVYNPALPVNNTTSTLAILFPSLAAAAVKIINAGNSQPAQNAPIVLPNEGSNQILIPTPGSPDNSGQTVTPVTLPLPTIDPGSNSPTGQPVDADDDSGEYTAWWDGD